MRYAREFSELEGMMADPTSDLRRKIDRLEFGTRGPSCHLSRHVTPKRPPVAPGTEPPRETRRSMAVVAYGAVGALVGLVAGWVLRGMW